MFNLTQKHIEYLSKIVKIYGSAYIHGDGNIYVDETASDFRKSFSNPNMKASEYRLKFVKGDKLPADIDSLTNMFIASKTNEEIDKGKTKEQISFKSVKLDEPKDEEINKKLNENGK